MVMNDQRKSRISKRQSARPDKIAEKHAIDEDEGEGLVKGEQKALETTRDGKSESPDLTTDQSKQEDIAETVTSPTVESQGETGTTTEEQPVRRDSLTTELVTPTSPSTASPLKFGRWSNAIPSLSISVIRHVNQLQTSPMIAPAWGWRKPNLGKDEVEGVEDVKENLVNASPTSPVKES